MSSLLNVHFGARTVQHITKRRHGFKKMATNAKGIVVERAVYLLESNNRDGLETYLSTGVVTDQMKIKLVTLSVRLLAYHLFDAFHEGGVGNVRDSLQGEALGTSALRFVLVNFFYHVEAIIPHDYAEVFTKLGAYVNNDELSETNIIPTSILPDDYQRNSDFLWIPISLVHIINDVFIKI